MMEKIFLILGDKETFISDIKMAVPEKFELVSERVHDFLSPAEEIYFEH